MKGKRFRCFWLAALGKPALITLIFTSLATWALVDFTDSSWLIACAFVPLIWFYGRYLAWRTTMWTFDAATKTLVMQKGIIGRDERRIPLNFPPQVIYSQNWVGRLLNFGSAELSSFGGPVTFHQVGDFRAFRDVLTSPGKALPEQGASLPAIVAMAFLVGLVKLGRGVVIGLVWLVRTAAPLLVKLLRWLFGQAQAGLSGVADQLSRLVRTFAPLPARFMGWLRKQVRAAVSVIAERTKSPPLIQRAKVSASHANFDGFLAFCADFLLSNSHGVLPLDYTRPDGGRRYYPTGISPEVAHIYFSILRRARIVILGTNGYSGWILRRQINTIDDIERRISGQDFDDVANREFLLGRIEQMTVPNMKEETLPASDQREQHWLLLEAPLVFPGDPPALKNQGLQRKDASCKQR